MSEAAEIEGRAVALLAAREHSRAELARKLAARGHRDEAVAAVLDRLAARGLQSDQRFTEAYVAMRRGRGYGPRRIRAELRERGVAEGVIEAWLDERDPEWRRCLAEVLARRFGASGTLDRREQARRARFLEYRGFPPDQIRALLWDR